MAEEEDVLDSWEDAADTGDLERRMEEREKILKEQESNFNDLSTSLLPGAVTILKSETLGRTEYSPQVCLPESLLITTSLNRNEALEERIQDFQLGAVKKNIKGISKTPPLDQPLIKILKRSGLKNTKAAPPKTKTEAEMKLALKLREAEYQAARDRILGENYDEEIKAKLENNEEIKISIIKNPSRSSPNSPLSPVKLLSTESSFPVGVLRQPSGPDETDGFKVDS